MDLRKGSKIGPVTNQASSWLLVFLHSARQCTVASIQEPLPRRRPPELMATVSPGLDPSSRQLPGRPRPQRQLDLEFGPSGPDVGETYIYDLPIFTADAHGGKGCRFPMTPTVLLSLTCDF